LKRPDDSRGIGASAIAAACLLRRRAFAGVVGLAALVGLSGRPARAADAASATVRRIGRLSPLSAEADVPMMAAFRKGLAGLGWVEGRDYVLEGIYADGQESRLAGLAAELVRRKVDLIVVGSNPGTLAAKRATGTVPIVMVTTGDPVEAGIVGTLARPGGNISGVTALGQGLSAKRLELLKQAVPGLARPALLTNPLSRYSARFLRESEAAAHALGLRLQVIRTSEPLGLEQAFADTE